MHTSAQHNRPAPATTPRRLHHRAGMRVAAFVIAPLLACSSAHAGLVSLALSATSPTTIRAGEHVSFLVRSVYDLDPARFEVFPADPEPPRIDHGTQYWNAGIMRDTGGETARAALTAMIDGQVLATMQFDAFGGTNEWVFELPLGAPGTASVVIGGNVHSARWVSTQNFIGQRECHYFYGCGPWYNYGSSTLELLETDTDLTARALEVTVLPRDNTDVPAPAAGMLLAGLAGMVASSMLRTRNRERTSTR